MLQRRALLSWLGATVAGWSWPEVALATVSVSTMFVIARSKNKNVVRYRARVHDGHLDAARPIDADWLMLAEDGRSEGLSWAERRLAYGFTVSDVGPDSCRLQLVAFKSRVVTVERHAQGFRAVTPIAGQMAVLGRVFVQTREGGLLPRVDYVELSGTSTTGTTVKERFSAP
ncbi:MAG TPA: DUF4833 domain-containing protein [Polyangiaceae bacterium]|nr:DUF4833 domain-containing protein [Polyangiaceae bacterium]